MTLPKRLRRFRCRPAILALALVLGACGGEFEGDYSDERGVSRYAFGPHGRVEITAMGISFEGEYELERDRVVVRGPNGTLVFHRREDRLEGPMGLVLYRAEALHETGDLE